MNKAIWIIYKKWCLVNNVKESNASSLAKFVYLYNKNKL
jgi:hypothetical protein